MKICLAQFAKSPEFDAVKTRLHPALTPAQATRLHKDLLRHLVQSFSELDELEHCLYSTRGGDFINELCRTHQLKHFQQSGISLGERLADASRQRLKNFDAVVLIGSDCPFLDRAIMRKVCELLANHDGVIIPAEDGGYVLLATKTYAPEIFIDIDWGTEEVFAQTQKKIEAEGLNFAVMAPLADIDRPEDLALLQANRHLAYLVESFTPHLP